MTNLEALLQGLSSHPKFNEVKDTLSPHLLTLMPLAAEASSLDESQVQKLIEIGNRAMSATSISELSSSYQELQAEFPELATKGAEAFSTNPTLVNSLVQAVIMPKKSEISIDDTLELPEDEVTISSKQSNPDFYFHEIDDSVEVKPDILSEEVDSVPEETIEVLKIKNTSSETPRRIAPTSVKTEEQAITYFINEVNRRYRFNQYDNMIDKLEPIEIEDALFDALEEINQHSPATDYNLLHFVTTGMRYRKLLILGTAKNALTTLISIWAANGINVSVEDLSVDNKFGDMQSFKDSIVTEFNELLEAFKSYDRLAVSQSTFSTGARQYSKVGNFNFRVGMIVRNGGRIG